MTTQISHQWSQFVTTDVISTCLRSDAFHLLCGVTLFASSLPEICQQDKNCVGSLTSALSLAPSHFGTYNCKSPFLVFSLVLWVLPTASPLCFFDTSRVVPSSQRAMGSRVSRWHSHSHRRSISKASGGMGWGVECRSRAQHPTW